MTLYYNNALFYKYQQVTTYILNRKYTLSFNWCSIIETMREKISKYASKNELNDRKNYVHKSKAINFYYFVRSVVCTIFRWFLLHLFFILVVHTLLQFIYCLDVNTLQGHLICYRHISCYTYFSLLTHTHTKPLKMLYKK